jgi:cold shock protein
MFYAQGDGFLSQFHLYYYNTMSMQTGRVKFFNSTKGFGFIVDDQTNQEVFVHVSGLKHPIAENDHVEFQIKDGKKGPNAVEVAKIN